MENFLLGLILLQITVYAPFGNGRNRLITCNHSKDAKVCFWKKEEQRIHSASCEDCNKDVIKINCPVCKVPYHVKPITYNVSGVELSNDFFKIKWIWNLGK